ncbi:hypothetical protein [Blastococcus sp. SYSU DS0619]
MTKKPTPTASSVSISAVRLSGPISRGLLDMTSQSSPRRSRDDPADVQE